MTEPKEPTTPANPEPDGVETPPPGTTEPNPEPEADLDPEPTPRQLAAHLQRLETKLDQLIEAGASRAAIEATQDQIADTEAAILETPASDPGTDLEAATTDPGQESDPARSGDQTDNSSPDQTEPETPRRKRRKALGRRKRE